MALVSRDDILSAHDLKRETVEVPEWGGEVLLRTLSGRERDAFEASMVKTKGNKRIDNLENLRARLVALCMIDEQGKQLFRTTAEIAMLGDKSIAALQRVYNKCAEMNGMSDQDVEDLTEGFDEEPDESSTSD